MSESWLEFFVHSVTLNAVDSVDVIGRCGEYAIRLQDTFTLAYRLTPTKTFEQGFEPFIREGERDVHLRVVGIEAYRKLLDELSPGMTGRLSLVGSGEQIKDKDVLGWVLDEGSERRR